MTKRFLLGGIALLIVMVIAGCARALVRVDGPYEGRVIDSETREPIQGVVVLGIWYSVTPTVAGGVSEFYDAKETVTDGNGEFRIDGLGLRVATNVAPMDVTIFKAGYECVGPGPWAGLDMKGWQRSEDTRDPVTHIVDRKEIYDETLRVKWEGKKLIIPLRKLTREEMGCVGVYPPFPASVPSEVPRDKARFMLEEIRKDEEDRETARPKVIRRPRVPRLPNNNRDPGGGP